jgi:hypothetical protein
MLGMFLSKRLPHTHLQAESKDSIHLGTGLIATLTALVLGLLVASTKSDFDAVNTGLVDASAKVVTLDRVLAQYGPEAAEARSLLRDAMATALARYWPEENIHPATIRRADAVAPIEGVHAMLRQLTPQNDSQRWLQSNALQLCADVAQSRWQLLEQTYSDLPMPFLVIVVFWLTMLFTSFSLFAPRNITVMVVFLLCALSVASAIFLLLEMGHPSEGLMKASAEPLLRAYSLLGR